MPGGLTVRGYARHRGVSHTAVVKALATGRITLGPEGRIDPTLADQQWAVATDLSKPSNSVTGEPGRRSRPSARHRQGSATPHVAAATRGVADREAGVPVSTGERVAASYRESLAAREAYRARLAKLDFEERTGKLVNADEVRAATFRVARATRDRIMGVPARLAPILAATSDQLEVQRMLEEALRDVCAETSHAVRAMKTAGPSGEQP